VISSSTTTSTSTRPYLIRALHEWCVDNGFTPLITVQVDANTRVPKEHVKDKEIVLNLSFDATSGLKLGNDYIEFKARFSGVARDILVPVNRVVAIYARENSQGMAFPSVAATDGAGDADEQATAKDDQVSKQAAAPVATRPSLKIVK
jgi:stringent starvation protein B